MSIKQRTTPSNVSWRAGVNADPTLVPLARRRWARAYKRTLRAERRRERREKAVELVGTVALSFVSVAALLYLLFGLT